MKKGKIGVSIVLGIISMFLVIIMSIQLRTIDQTDITSLETMEEEELRSEILDLKEKNEELQGKIEENQNKINEYKETLNNNQKASELLNNELQEYEKKIGLTDVNGQGIILTLTDNDERTYSASDFVDLINELKYAWATAISINDKRIISTTEIVDITKRHILLNGDQRISSPFTIKAIGDKQKLSETLNLKDEGLVDLYKNVGYTINLEENDNITIYKYDKEIDFKYIEKGEE